MKYVMIHKENMNIHSFDGTTFRYAVIASGCASCPKLKCERPGCESYFCYHCKAEWHPNQTCDMARAQRSPNAPFSSFTYLHDLQNSEFI